MTKQPIILCGYTSCGKTTVGRLLAKKLNIDFYDTDQMLTEQSQITIAEIFLGKTNDLLICLRTKKLLTPLKSSFSAEPLPHQEYSGQFCYNS